MDTTTLDTTSLLDSASSEAMNSVMGLLTPLLVASAVSLVVLLVVFIVSAIGKHKERAAILQTAEEVTAIRTILESHYSAKAPVYKPPITAELKNDPQVPSRP